MSFEKNEFVQEAAEILESRYRLSHDEAVKKAAEVTGTVGWWIKVQEYKAKKEGRENKIDSSEVVEKVFQCEHDLTHKFNNFVQALISEFGGLLNPNVVIKIAIIAGGELL